MPKILVVDDDRGIVEMLQIGLSSLNYDSIVAYEGESVFKLVDLERPDIILLDLNLPGKNGFQVCREIREKITDTYIPIIMLTARDDLGSKIEGLDTGADDYITKPVDIKEVLARVKSMLRIKSLQDELRMAKNELQELAVRDYLTGCYNRRYFTEILQMETKKAVRYDQTFACVMVDADRFKVLNDTYGHLAGDIVLKGIADALRYNLRDSDIIARYGGEEFVLLLPNIPNEIELKLICERIRTLIEHKTFFFEGKELQVTISVGAGLFSGKDIPGPEQLISLVDSALYRAKREGRNCFRLAN